MSRRSQLSEYAIEEVYAADRLALVGAPNQGSGLAQDAGVQVETVRQSNDHPWEAIVHTAKDKQCDLIVMDSHGRRGLSAIVLGSETQKVLIHSTVPVLVVR